MRVVLPGDERHWTGFVEPHAHHCFAHASRRRPQGIIMRGRRAEGPDVSRKPVVAVEARDPLYQIDLDRGVRPPSSARSISLETSARQLGTVAEISVAVADTISKPARVR